MAICCKSIVAIIMQTGILCLSACSGTYKNREDSVALEEQELLSLPLDSTTTQETSYLQLIGDSILSFFNPPMYEICLYDLSKREPIYKVRLRREGPDAVSGITGYCFQSSDSIWLYASWGKVLYLINNEGKIKNKINIGTLLDIPGDENLSVTPYPTSSTPYAIINGKHVLQGMGRTLDKSKEPGATIIYDLTSNTIQTANKYPDIYGDKSRLYDNWDVFAYLQTNYTFSPDGNIVTSFPASDSIYVYNPDTRLRKSFFAGYSRPTGIHPEVTGDPENSQLDYLRKYAYSNILYDKYAKLYYRFIRLPYEPETDNLDIEITKKPIAVIILDENFNIVGESELPIARYYPMHSFVDSEGLHINVVSEDDDYMTFKTFKAINR